MKRILVTIAIFGLCSTANADTCASKLTGPFPSAQAKALCSILGSNFGSDFIPQTDDAYDLGSASKEWQDAFFDGTVRADGLTMDADINFSTSGNTVALQEATAGAKCMGLVTSNGTTAVTVSTTCATTNSRILFSALDDQSGTTTAHCWTTNIVNGVSFDFDCDGASNASFNWIIFHEAP